MIFPYLVGRALYRVRLFLSDWYFGSFRLISRGTIDFLERLDRTWALWITFRNIFQPLYQDHTFTGRILGFFFRVIRIAIGLTLYAFVVLIALIAYLIIVVMPVYILYLGFGPQS